MTIDKHYYWCQALRFSVLVLQVPTVRKCMVRYKNLLWNVCDGMDNASDGKVERCVFIQRGKKHFMNHPTSTKLHVKKKKKQQNKRLCFKGCGNFGYHSFK